MTHYLTIDLGYAIANPAGPKVTLESLTFDKRRIPATIDLSQKTMQEIWERNKERINDPKYDVDLKALFSLG